MGNPHALLIPYPAQGHVIPLMELSLVLVRNGIKITFVNTEFNHKRVVNALDGKKPAGDLFRLMAIPDGLEPWEDRNDLGKLSQAMLKFMPEKLKELIEEINASDSDNITCLFVDVGMGWSLDVAAKMGINRALFWTASMSLAVLAFRTQKLVDEGVVDNIGTPLTSQMIQLSPGMPAMNPEHLVWLCIGGTADQKTIFELTRTNYELSKLADWHICNSAYDLEPAALAMEPDYQPVGPLLASTRQGSSVGHFWSEDSSCLEWLDQQPLGSVIYVAFGSFTVLDKTQFQELALGLELSNRPFLWVVRPDITDKMTEAYPDGFLERVADRARMVGWAPQQKVLSHPSIACFISHCGWNSTLEGVCNGLSFLCWPYFADQFLNETYICDVWKIGLKFSKDGNGIITRDEIKSKVEKLLGDGGLKERVMDLKTKTENSTSKNGSSHQNLERFIEWIKEM